MSPDRRRRHSTVRGRERARSSAPSGSPEGAPARRAAAAALDRVLEALVPADPALARFDVRLEERDRRLARELLFGALRWKRRLELVIERASRRSMAEIDAPLHSPLLIALVQLLLLDRIPAHAAVSNAVDEARRRGGRGAAGFANAVLRNVARRPHLDDLPIDESDPIRRAALETSHPDRLVERWWSRFGAERTRTMLESSNAERPLHLLTFADRGGREPAALRLAGEGCATVPSRLSPAGLVVTGGNPLRTDAFASGDVYVQDEASQAAALVPPPAAGERVLDVAAAPGGKGLALLARQPSVRWIAADLSLRRLSLLRDNLKRLGRSASVAVADASASPWLPEFDRVILDASCSGTGTLRRHPELKWRFREPELERLADSALEQLVSSASAVRRGGRLVHVTCSIEPEENERVVERFLESFQGFDREELDPDTAPGGEPNLLSDGLWRVVPEAGHDGFSVSVLRRRR